MGTAVLHAKRFIIITKLMRKISMDYNSINCITIYKTTTTTSRITEYMSDNEKQMLRFLYYCMVSTKGKKGEVSAHLLPAKTMHEQTTTYHDCSWRRKKLSS